MNFDFTAEELGFREEVRQFIKENLPADIHRKMVLEQRLSRFDIVRWQKILKAQGWAVPHWPQEWGGRNWSLIQRYIFTEELHRWPAPEALSFNVNMVGPVIIRYGTAEQRQRFLPAIANLDMWFCQGFSEPGAGSDLAALSTSAVRVGDEYVINGQKIWTSKAHYADWMFCLVRTDPHAQKRQEGITYLLLDLKTPGITIRPIITIDGLHHFNEVFFDDVRVPVTNRIGDENKGWTYAKFLLGNERGGQPRIGISKGRLDRIKALARSVAGPNGQPVSESSEFRKKVSLIEAELKALELTQLRVLTASREPGTDDPAASILKIKGTELQQATTELLMELAGPDGLRVDLQFLAGQAPFAGGEDWEWAASAMPNYFFWRELTIAGGTTEIQKNIVAKRVLGL